jgi:hypothetical protein
MKYSGIDLHSNNSVVVVSDEVDRVLVRRRVANDAAAILALLAAHREELVGVVVESTYNSLSNSAVARTRAVVSVASCLRSAPRAVCASVVSLRDACAYRRRRRTCARPWTEAALFRLTSDRSPNHLQPWEHDQEQARKENDAENKPELPEVGAADVAAAVVDRRRPGSIRRDDAHDAE